MKLKAINELREAERVATELRRELTHAIRHQTRIMFRDHEVESASVPGSFGLWERAATEGGAVLAHDGEGRPHLTWEHRGYRFLLPLEDD